MSATIIRRLLAASLALAAAAPVAAQTGPAGTVRYYHADALGSVRAVTDAQGNVVARHDYFAFGEEPAGAPNPATPRFTGQERDTETGMDYFGARYYVQRLGRFTTSDPEHIGGNTFDPQSWNAYAYARNNPMRVVDPTGTDYLVNIDTGQSFWASNAEFERLQGNPGAGISLFGGLVLAGGRIVGTYQYYSPFDRILVDAGRRAEPGVNAAVTLGVAATAIPAAAIGGGALVVGRAAITSLAIGSAPLLPAVPSAVAKLQRINLTVAQASEIVTNLASTKFIDKLNGGNINVFKDVGDKIVRITLDPTGQRIVSAGYVQSRNIANGIATGRFVPK